MGLIVCADFYHEKHAFIDIAYFLKKKTRAEFVNRMK